MIGKNNFVANIPWRKRTAKSDVPFGVSQDYESILCYAKSSMFSASIENSKRKYFETDDFPSKPWRIHDLTTQRTAEERPNSFFSMENPRTGEKYPANPLRTWAITIDHFMIII
jgi:adenine-specific DNA-methyltransferase